jgi:NitT/TauT family transport system substrate-binding protein
MLDSLLQSTSSSSLCIEYANTFWNFPSSTSISKMGSIDTDDFEQRLQRFHVSATSHSLNYLPGYIANRHGDFREQGLEVTVSVPHPWDRVLDDLADGSPQAALGGIWMPSMYQNRHCNYTAFAQVANRTPLAIVSCETSHPFRFSDIVGRTVLMKGRNGASVGLFFKVLLRENRIDPQAVNDIQDLDGTMLPKLFVGGIGDYLVMEYLSARALFAAHSSKLQIAQGAMSDAGDIPWSVYYCQSSTITSDTMNAQERFCVALAQGMNWVLGHDTD